MLRVLSITLCPEPGLGVPQSAVEEPLNLACSQFPTRAGRNTAIGKMPDANSPQLGDRVPDTLEHPAYLLILALPQRHPVPRVAGFPGPPDSLYVGGSSKGGSNPDPAPQPLDLLPGRRALDFHKVDFWN